MKLGEKRKEEIGNAVSGLIRQCRVALEEDNRTMDESWDFNPTILELVKTAREAVLSERNRESRPLPKAVEDLYENLYNCIDFNTPRAVIAYRSYIEAQERAGLALRTLYTHTTIPAHLMHADSFTAVLWYLEKYLVGPSSTRLGRMLIRVLERIGGWR